MTKRTTVKGNAFNDPNHIHDLQATPVPIAWLFQLHGVLKTIPDNQQAKWMLEDVAELLLALHGYDAFDESTTYQYTVTLKRKDGTIHDEQLDATDDSHAIEEAGYEWLDEEVIATKRGQPYTPEEPKRIIWVK